MNQKPGNQIAIYSTNVTDWWNISYFWAKNSLNILKSNKFSQKFSKNPF